MKSLFRSAMLLVVPMVGPARAATFQGLGALAGDSASYAYGVSGNGSVVVGFSEATSESYEAFRWNRHDGIVGLGDLPGGWDRRSRAYAVSANGSVIVGFGDGALARTAFRWTRNRMVELGPSVANSLSDDGSVVVGYSGNPAFDSEAFRWTAAGGMVSLGDLPGGANVGIAYDVSADGSVVVGSGSTAAGEEAFRWTSEEGMVGLGDLPGGVSQSYAYAISADASVIVGRGRSADGFEAFRWTSVDGMVGLGDLIGGGFESIAYDVSNDGSVIVGYGKTNLGNEAFFWDEKYGLRRLQRLLTNQGLDLTGWRLVEARGVSANGRTIVGWGRNPSGQAEAWIATVPEPSAFALVAIATTVLFVNARRKPIQPRA